MDFQSTALGIEFGTTRIKAVLIDRNHQVLAVGSHTWENELTDGVWTYSEKAILDGLQACYADLKRNTETRYGQKLTTVGAIGISAMMHGYLPLDGNGRPLAAFRTWRNTMTAQASEILTEIFHFHIPQRWTIAHLYQAILNREEHVKDIAYLTTLAGYIHWRLSGEKKAGLGEASGIVPLDQKTMDYDQSMIDRFEELISCRQYPWKLRDILPQTVMAGCQAGALTEEGAKLLDPSGTLCPGIPLVPCEGDADTGMVATDSVRPRTANVSAGTSAFIMVVADHPLGIHKEVDMLCTPCGQPVAMVHSSNCTSDLNAWMDLFSEFADMIGAPQSKKALYPLLFEKALEGRADGGGLLSYNYYSGESVTGLNEGRPVFARMPDADFTLASFMRTHLFSALSTLKIGYDILSRSEQVSIDRVYCHGGFFKTPEVGQRILSAALGQPVSVMETAGEGGPYGMALLAAYMLWKDGDESLPDYLDNRVFASVRSTTLTAAEEEMEGFAAFLERYKKALPLEKCAVEVLRDPD
ncbi:MAG: ATPase [Oscillospiraceae bacterium]|nr:ATPase [Oscillospiraceae bacterium]